MKILALAAAILFFAFPMAGFAEDDPSLWPFGYWGPILSCTGEYYSTGTPAVVEGSPTETCTSLCDVLKTARNVAYLGITVVFFVLAPVMVLAGGLLILMAGGSPKLLDTGRKTIWSAVVGAIIAFGSFLIISTFLWLIGNPSPTSDKPRVSWPDINCQSSNVPGYPISPVAPPGGEE